MKGGREEKNEAFPELSWNKMILGDNSGKQNTVLPAETEYSPS